MGGMDNKTAHTLRELNNRFYQQQAGSFSSTRNNSWPGWELCLEAMDADIVKRGCANRSSAMEPPSVDSNPNCAAVNYGFVPTSVADVACGNMRFLPWLQGKRSDVQIDYWGFDSCPELADAALAQFGEGVAAHSHFVQLDALEVLLGEVGEGEVADDSGEVGEGLLLCDGGDGTGSGFVDGRQFDLVCCFGFMHHVPGVENRVNMLRMLLDMAKPGGYVAVSFWQFMNSPELAKRALGTTEEGLIDLRLEPDALEPGDYLLGWNGQDGAYRYCHHFEVEELESLASQMGDQAELITHFDCDGRTGNLNGYLVLRKMVG